MNTLYKKIMEKVNEVNEANLQSTFAISKEMSEKIFVIPPSRTRYLSEIAENNRAYDASAKAQQETAQRLYGIYKTIETLLNAKPELDKSGVAFEASEEVSQEDKDLLKLLVAQFDRVKLDLDPYNWEVITGWEEKVNRYKNPVYTFKVRDKEIKIDTHTESLSHTQIPKVALPILRDYIPLNVQEKILHVCLQEKEDQNVPINVFTM